MKPKEAMELREYFRRESANKAAMERGDANELIVATMGEGDGAYIALVMISGGAMAHYPVDRRVLKRLKAEYEQQVRGSKLSARDIADYQQHQGRKRRGRGAGSVVLVEDSEPSAG